MISRMTRVIPDAKEYDADYRHLGCTHGHMCLVGDNKLLTRALADCFQVMNVCPQTERLNSGLLNTIEKRCREWADIPVGLYRLRSGCSLDEPHFIHYFKFLCAHSDNCWI